MRITYAKISSRPSRDCSVVLYLSVDFRCSYSGYDYAQLNITFNKFNHQSYMSNKRATFFKPESVRAALAELIGTFF